MDILIWLLAKSYSNRPVQRRQVKLHNPLSG